MQVTLRTAVMAALAVGGSFGAFTANATNVTMTAPSAGGGSQLVFWVSDTSNNTTFADVLTQTVAGVFTPPGNGAAGVVNSYTGSSNFSTTVGGDSSLVNFISAANSAGQNLEWGITAGATSNSNTPGTNTMIVTGAGTSAGINTTAIGKSSLISAVNAWGGDVTQLVAQSTDGSGFNATTNGIIGTPASGSGTNITYYGYYPNQSGLALSASSTLYAITNQQGSTYPNGVSFGLGTASLSGSGATLALNFVGNNGGTTPPVPLPAAVWLLGSGLLGLAGVGRRRSSKTGAIAA